MTGQSIIVRILVSLLVDISLACLCKSWSAYLKSFTHIKTYGKVGKKFWRKTRSVNARSCYQKCKYRLKLTVFLLVKDDSYSMYANTFVWFDFGCISLVWLVYGWHWIHRVMKGISQFAFRLSGPFQNNFNVKTVCSDTKALVLCCYISWSNYTLLFAQFGGKA